MTVKMKKKKKQTAWFYVYLTITGTKPIEKAVVVILGYKKIKLN